MWLEATCSDLQGYRLWFTGSQSLELKLSNLRLGSYLRCLESQIADVWRGSIEVCTTSNLLSLSLSVKPTLYHKETDRNFSLFVAFYRGGGRWKTAKNDNKSGEAPAKVECIFIGHFLCQLHTDKTTWSIVLKFSFSPVPSGWDQMIWNSETAIWFWIARWDTSWAQ